MKTIEQRGQILNVPVVELYLLDLERLVELMTFTPEAKVVIHKDDKEFEDLADLAKHLGPVHSTFEIRTPHTATGYLGVTFKNAEVNIYATGDGKARLHDIADLFRKRRRLAGYGGEYWWPLGLVVSTACAVCAVALKWPLNAVAAVFGLYVAFAPKPFLGNRLILNRRHEHQNFWQKNSENIWRLGIGVVGGAVGWLLNTWFGK